MVSIVIPTLDEAEALPFLADNLAGVTKGGEYEVVVCDGGSTDGTLQFADGLGWRCVLGHRAQRAAQMNAGVAQARGSILLFLHADTLLPPLALERVEAACRESGVVGGAFARRYDSRSRWLGVTCWLARWRNRWFGWHLGDQGIFVRRDVFDRLGGFREFDVFEDVDFSRRMARVGRVRTLVPPVISSARRFAARGALRTSLRDGWLMLRYLLGAAPGDLASARAGRAGLQPFSERLKGEQGGYAADKTHAARRSPSTSRPDQFQSF